MYRQIKYCDNQMKMCYFVLQFIVKQFVCFVLVELIVEFMFQLSFVDLLLSFTHFKGPFLDLLAN